ncbi:hypothetical protein LUZ60_001377 [Juncus effusus]|nr:hypothetical protein LUZ60_001377 [Juncus effusus]
MECRVSNSMIICCKLYISEARNTSVLKSIEEVAKLHPEVVLINNYKDEVYNRVSYTLVSHSNTNALLDATPLKNAVFGMVKTALEKIDLTSHCGAHPRLGVVDHIVFHPLGETKLDQVAELCRSMAAEIGKKLQLPIYLYGAAHPEGKTLEIIRKELGYFHPNFEGNQWKGDLNTDISLAKPDEGPTELSPSKGLATIGATPWVGTCNVPIHTENTELVKQIARNISEKGGGLKSVQAIVVVYGENSCEVACYLLDPLRVGLEQVQNEVERVCSELGLVVGKGYMTNLLPDKVLDSYLKAVGGSGLGVSRETPKPVFCACER